MMYFFINREVLHDLFDYMSELFPYSSNTGLQEKTMQEWVRLKFRVLLLWATTLMFAFFVALWPLAVKDRYLINVLTKKLSPRQFVINNQKLVTFNRKLAYDVWYPFDSEKSPNYELIFALQTTTECIMLMTYAICDGIFPCFCVIIVGQFQILSTKFSNKQIECIKCCFSGHNIVNIVNTALLQSKVSRDLVEKFAKDFNWPAFEKEG